MVEYRLHYFPVHGRGDPLRLMLAHAKADWEDCIMQDWANQKPNFPGGAMPCLELKDGTKLGQSAAIGNYLGRKLGYLSSDPLQAYENDAIIQYLMDRYEGIILPAYGTFKDEAEQKEKQVKAIEEEFPKLMTNLDEWLKEDKFLLGDKLSVCDFFVGSFYLAMCVNPKGRYGVEDGKWAKILKKYPKFKAYGERFRAENKEYVESKRGEYTF